MAEVHDWLSPIEAPGIGVSLDRGLSVASLRYFDRDGPMARTVQATLGVPLPEISCATCAVPSTGGEAVILAWRGPTETIVVCADAALITKLETDLAAFTEGCIVDQTGGTWVLRAGGNGVAALFARLGGQAVLPELGEARRSRLADLPVLVIQIQRGDLLLVVERAYAEHLMNWLRVSAADMEAS